MELPLGLPPDVWESMIPKDNPMTSEKVALGEKLYFDKRLSSDRTVSCATCHDPATALADNNMVGIAVERRPQRPDGSQWRADGIWQTLKILSG